MAGVAYERMDIVGNLKVNITEQTLNELKTAADKAKSYGKEKVLVASHYSDLEFEIDIETKPNTQESIGYRIKNDWYSG